MVDTRLGGRRREAIRLDAFLDHADAALDTLLPRDRDLVVGSEFFTRTKLAAETALLLHVAERADADLGDRLLPIADRLRHPARAPEVLAWVRLLPAIIRELSVAHRVLTAFGHPDPAIDAALADAASTCPVAPIERMPWKQVERSRRGEIGAPLGPHAVRVDLAATPSAAVRTPCSPPARRCTASRAR